MITQANGTVFQGEYNTDMKHGHGIETRPDGSRYEGEYWMDKKTGRGMYTWANGTRYEGPWYNGVRHGRGRELYPDGSSYEGVWIDGRKQGRGIYLAPQGRFIQEWLDDQLQATLMYDPNIPLTEPPPQPMLEALPQPAPRVRSSSCVRRVFLTKSSTESCGARASLRIPRARGGRPCGCALRVFIGKGATAAEG